MGLEELYIMEKHNQEKSREKIYISGGITNNRDYKKQFTGKYRELESAGYVVLTPLFINAELSWDEYMHIDYAMIDICNCIYMMRGWSNSRGARLEHDYALQKGLHVFYEDKDELYPKG